MKGFSPTGAAALEFARLIASELGHTYIGSEHLLLSLLSESDSDGQTKRIFSHFKIYYADVLSRVVSLFGRGEKTHLTSNDITVKLKRILERSGELAKKRGTSLSGEHLAIGLLSERDSVGVKLIELSGVKSSKILNLFLSAIENEEKISLEKFPEKSRHEKFSEMKKQTPILNKYGRDLTEEAFKGNFTVLVGRDREIDRVIRVLLRRGKNNPCLIGEPGVGKTAIAEGLAKRIADGTVPVSLVDFRIVSLDISSVVAGAKYRGDFEERIRSITEEIIKCENVILMIDEIHNIVGAGSAEGAIDAANILKPALARDEMRIIGATTLREYKKYIEKDAALERRFQPIEVREPTPKETLEILRGIRKNYEDFHGVKIEDSALSDAVSLSVRFIPERFLPDKAIDIIDEVCAKKKIENGNTVTSSDIAEAVREITGVPLGKISVDEREVMTDLAQKLKKRVIGQDFAVEELVSAYIRSRLAFSDTSRPRGAYLFVGPTGVGKTELARAFASEVFDDTSYIKLDMSEYAEKHSTSKLIGAPPGYVGYEDASCAFEKLRRHPFSVVVFDEIEKAHPDVLNLLLQILDEGKLTDSQGRHFDFKNTVIILTSNIGTGNDAAKGVGFSVVSEDNTERERVMKRVRETLAPELISRLDEVLVFSKLRQEHFEKIAEVFVGEFIERAKGEGVEIEVDKEVVLKILRARDEKFGARGIQKLVKKELEQPVSRFVLEHPESKKKLTVRIGENGGISVVPCEKITLS